MREEGGRRRTWPKPSAAHVSKTRQVLVLYLKISLLLGLPLLLLLLLLLLLVQNRHGKKNLTFFFFFLVNEGCVFSSCKLYTAKAEEHLQPPPTQLPKFVIFVL